MHYLLLQSSLMFPMTFQACCSTGKCSSVIGPEAICLPMPVSCAQHVQSADVTSLIVAHGCHLRFAQNAKPFHLRHWVPGECGS